MIRACIAIICIIAVTLLLYNQVLIEEIKTLEVERFQLKSMNLDLRMRHDGLWDEVLRLENILDTVKRDD